MVWYSATIGRSASEVLSSATPSPLAISRSEPASPRWPTVPFFIALPKSLGLMPTPALACSCARRLARSITRCTRTRRMCRVAWVSRIGNRSIAKPGFTPTDRITMPALRAFSSKSSGSRSTTSGSARSSQVVTTCAPCETHWSMVGTIESMSDVVHTTATSGRARASMSSTLAPMVIPTRPSPMISPRSRPAFAGSWSATPTSRTRASSRADLAISCPIQPRPTTPIRIRSDKRATPASYRAPYIAGRGHRQ